MEPILRAEATYQSVLIFPGHAEIHNSYRLAAAPGTVRQIPFRSIVAVEFEPARFAVEGSLRFILSGDASLRKIPVLRSNVRDLNIIKFFKHQQPAFEVVRDYIVKAITAGPAP